MLDMISWDNFSKQIKSKEQVVLLACIHAGVGFNKQINLLHRVCKAYEKELKICVVHDDSREAIQSSLAIHGTPFYIVYYHGEEKGRILGEANWDKLTNLLTSLISTKISSVKAKKMEKNNKSRH